ncbi:DUF998 domain-containing protein [Methanobacterium sp.]|uniref:DUF998 domain-containing protein n=1 Tax=Methanobacterium sp. TaxID=2164 RepID=UPI003C78ED10
MKFQKGSIFKPDKDYYKIAGMLLVIGGIMYVLAINIGESLFPGYSVATNSLSDIGGMLPLIQPAANIFNSVNIILGLLIISSAYLIIKSGGCRLFSACLVIFGFCIGALGVFPEYTHLTHVVFATIAFFSGSFALIFSYRLGINIPMTILGIILGLIALITILSPLIFGIGPNNPLDVFGKGGAERLIIYPIIMYLTALGGYLSARGKDWVRIRFTNGYW